MGEFFEATASLRLFGDDLDPHRVSALLGAQPTACARKGELLAPGRDGRRRRAPTGSWRLRAGRRSPADLDALVQELLGVLTDDLDVWAGLTRRFRGDIFFGLFMGSYNEGVSLSPASLRSGGLRGLTFDFDVYGDGVRAG